MPKAGMGAEAGELARLRGVLQDGSSPHAALVTALRQLSCYVLTASQLQEQPELGRAIVALRRHGQPDVARLARALVDKLRGEMVAARRR